MNLKKTYLKPGGMFPLLSKLKNMSFSFKINTKYLFRFSKKYILNLSV